jgi:uncharacterized protein (UPF0276 family)
MLPPDRGALTLLEPLLDEIDYGEVAPETLWGPGRAPNGFHQILSSLAGALPFVAHGVGANLCGADGGHWPEHLRALARDHQLFQFLWISDHLGAVQLAGQHVGLPVPVSDWEGRLARRLGYFQALVGVAAVENSAWYAPIQGMAQEAAGLRDALGQQHHLVLDLHNLWCNGINGAEDVEGWLDAAPLERVIEIHISGGSDAPQAWSPERRRRMDSHDSAVPEEVWSLLERVVPLCPGLRGVTLERLENTFGAQDVPVLQGELRRIRSVLGSHGAPLGVPGQGSLASALELVDEGQDSSHEQALLEALVSRVPLDGMDKHGVGIAARLVLRLRFERLIHGCSSAAAHFERDPRDFAKKMGRYHREVPLGAATPWGEAGLWQNWSDNQIG